MQLDEEGSVSAAGTQIRIFRNRANLGYRRRIHEQLGRMDGTPMHMLMPQGSFPFCTAVTEGRRGRKKGKWKEPEP